MRSDCGERRATAVTGGGAYRPPQLQVVCPRCSSTNTKFCYYNNYNLSQPRHLCKSCRRYWTHGGSLRNVPVGGATRKPNKRSRGSNPISVQSSTLLINDAVSGQESITSLLASQEPTEVGPATAFDEMGRYNSGGRGFWAFPEAAEGGGDLGSDTWQLGGVADGDWFQWPELAISVADQGLEWS